MKPRNRKRFGAWHGIGAAAALLSIALSLHALHRADAGVAVTAHRLGATPLRIYRPAGDGSSAPRPLVVISHGFAGSQQLMKPFAVTLARNGYTAVTFDYLGHGANTAPLGGDVTAVEGATQQLLEQTAAVVAYASALPDVAGDGPLRLALLGHSMASDVVVRYAIAHPRVDATIAVSMFSPAVTAEEPHNLLVIVGAWEPYLVREGERVLDLAAQARVGEEADPPAASTGNGAGDADADAGPSAGAASVRTVGSLARGDARRLVVAPGVEHVGVLYSPTSMRAAVAWLDGLWGHEGSGYADDRGLAVLGLLAGVVLLAWPLSRALPWVGGAPPGPPLGWGRLLPLAILPAVATPLLLWWFPADFLGVLVGGYLAVHFAVYGVLTWLCLRWLGPRHGRVSAAVRAAAQAVTDASPAAAREAAARRPLLRGAIAVLLASAWTTGVMALVFDREVTSFVPPLVRVPLLLAMLVGTGSYFLADAALCRARPVPRFAQAFTHLCFLASLALAVALSLEELFFLVIIAVLIALYFLVYGLYAAWINRATGHPAVAAIANAVAFAWALAVVFPMMTGR